MSIIRIPTNLRLSDDEPEIPQDFYHELVVWLSLKSLSCYWEVYPDINKNLPEIREAAREALFNYHEQNRNKQVKDLFRKALQERVGEDVYNLTSRFLEGAAKVNAAMNAEDNSLSDWSMWFSSNQHHPEELGIEPAMAAQLMHYYREEFVKKYREHDDYVGDTVKTETLDDWDLFIQQAYDACYEETDRWPESIILISIDQLYTEMLFNHFMRTRVLALPEDDQQLLLDAIRAEALETIKLEIEEPDPVWAPLFPPPDDPEEEVQKIRPAKEVVIWW